MNTLFTFFYKTSSFCRLRARQSFLHLIYFLVFFLSIASPVWAFNNITVTQEAEENFVYSGPGTHAIRSRGAASNLETVWINEVGAQVSWDLTIPANGNYSLIVRYSNDDTGTLDNIGVKVNGTTVGTFESEDTGDFGLGWNVFVESPTISLGQLEEGPITLSLSLDAHDGFGIEFDLLTLTGTNIQPPATPELISPIDGASNVPLDQLLDWSPSPGVNTYHLQVDNNPSFSTPEVDFSGLMNTEIQAVGLENGTTYHWRVRASNICETGSWSTPWTFTTPCVISAEIIASSSTTFCEGESIQLNAQGGDDYLWSTGETTPTIIVATSGTYSVSVSNGPNCSAASSITVTVLPALTPSITIEADNQDICGGTAITFEATTINGGNQPVYEWLVNGNMVGPDTPVFTANSLNDGDVVQCRLYNFEDCVTDSPVLSNTITVLASQAYYHTLQNFDFYVDRVKTFYNFFGGNSGVVNAELLDLEYDASETRTGYGRSLKITYDNLSNFSIYVESLERKSFDTTTWLNLRDLFPDFTNPILQDKQIDSIAFYGKLVATQPLTLQVKLEDADKGGATINQLIQPTSEWQRFAFALDDFTGNFNPEIAKFIGLNFDQGLGQNAGSSGVFYLDDIYLVENCYEKPEFSNPDEMMAYLNEVSFRHFWMAVEPESKFALDRHVWDDLISTDAIGFSLSAYVIAHKNGWIDPALIEARVENILTYLLDSCAHAPTTTSVIDDPLGYATVDGIWAHFLDNNTLARKDDRTEFSIFSTALLLAGVITAAAYFDSNPTIVAKADALYRMANWNFLLRQDGLMNYDWKPESGFSPYYTDWFSEELDLAFLLGISSPEPANQLPSNPYFLDEYRKPLCLDGDYIYSAPGSNFTYYFLQMYARFGTQTERFQNSRNALLADLDFCQSEYDALDYSPLIFGTTACEGPDSAGIDFIVGLDTFFISNYHAYGYCCKFDRHNTGNGTVAVYGSGSAALFLPQSVKDLWSYYYNELDDQFWSEYAYRFWSPIFGMPDAFHLSPDNTWDPLVNGLGFNGPWLSAPRFGIDVGPMLMNIDSYLSESIGGSSVRDYFSNHPLIAGNLSQFENIVSTDKLEAEVSIALVSEQTVCDGEELVFEATWDHGGDAPTVEWYVDQVLQQSGENSTFTSTMPPGNHQVVCKLVSDEHCIEGQETTSAPILITVIPSSSVSVTTFASDTEACVGEEITLNAVVTDGGSSPLYQWFLNGVAIESDNSFLILSEPAGKDTVTCVVTSSEACATGNPASSDPIIVEFHASPEISFQDVSSYCSSDEPTELNIALPFGGVYFGAGISDNVFAPAAVGEGAHAVSYTYADPITGCTNEADTVLLVASSLTASVNVSASADEVCPEETVVLTATPTNGGSSPTFDWSINGMGTDVTEQIMVTDGLNEGENTIVCTVMSSAECVVEPVVMSAPAVVTVHPSPTAIANNDGPVCENEEVILSAEGGVEYHWEGPNGFSSDEDIVVLEPGISLGMGTYSVTVTNSHGCSNASSTIVVVNAVPIIDSLYSNAPICDGDTLEVSVSADGVSYEWTAPLGDIYNQETVTIENANTSHLGTWILVATSLEGCSSLDELEVLVNILPSVSIDPTCFSDSIFTNSPSIPLDGCGTPPGGNFFVDSIDTDTIYSPLMVGQLEVQYSYADINGCTGTALEMIDVIQTTSQDDFDLEHKIAVFPNPSNGIFTITANGVRNNIQAFLYDPLGREIDRWRLGPNELTGRVFDFQHLPSGVYLFVLTEGVNRLSSKILIIN